MNTFLVHEDHTVTARCLDPQRLNRQITECIEICKVLFVRDKIRLLFHDRRIPFGIVFPPVTRLWIAPFRNSEITLMQELYSYYRTMCSEWQRIHKGIVHSTQDNFSWDRYLWPKRDRFDLVWPLSVYQSHRTKLLIKDPSHYSEVFRREEITVDESVNSYTWISPIILLPNT